MLIKNKGLIFIIILNILIFSFVVFSKDTSGFYFLDVGQGDSQLIIFKNKVKILIDGGRGDKVINELEEIFPKNERYIDLVVMTHPDLDHFEGLVEVIKRYEVGVFLGTGRRGDSFAYAELVNQIKERNIPYISIKEGDRIRMGEITLDVLSPSNTELISSKINDSSLVLYLKGEVSVLYTGDIDFRSEKRIVDKYDIDADILKVAHHGSKFASSEEFLSEVSPGISIIEVGKNSYGHPTEEALARLRRYSNQIFRTDLLGTVKVY